MTEVKILNLGGAIDEPKLKQVLGQISSIQSLAFPPLCLPDAHMKESVEAPCSFAVATKGTIVPELTAPSVGCGMGVLATSLNRDNITPEFYENFYTHMRDHLGPKYGFWKNTLLWFGIIQRPKNKYDFTRGELHSIIKKGAGAVLQKYNLPPDTLQHIERDGNAMESLDYEATLPQDILPRAAWVSGLHDIGYGFKGNHFLEIQYIEEILDPEIARTWGLHTGQVLIMYHGGGGAISHYLGRYFANRKKTKFREQWRLWIAKILFHFMSREGIQHLRERWKYYFVPEPFQEVPLQSNEGRRLFASIQASLNYSYAFRLAIAKRIQDALAAYGKPAQAKLLWDSIHNSIVTETVSGEQVVMHRHTATRVFECKPVIVSGFNNTNSYIGVGLKEAEAHLFSADHGAGETIKKFEKRGELQPHPENYTTDIFTTKPPYKKTVPHVTNEGLDYVMKNLVDAGITKPVVKLRPIAVFKG